MYRLWQETWILSSVDSQTLIQIPESPKDLLQKITCRNLPGLNFWDTGNWDFFFWLVIRINCGLNATTTRVTTVWLLLKDYSVSMVSDFLALVSLVFNLCKILKCSGCSQPHHFSRFLCFWFLQLQFYNGQWTGSGSTSCRRAEIAWPRCFGPRSPRCARLSRDRALCPVWTAWSFASNTSWRTKMPPTNSVITCPPRTANAALMPPRRATGKTGGWNICSDWGVTQANGWCLNYVLQSDILCRACSQECHGDACTDEETAVQPLPWEASVSAQRVQPPRGPHHRWRPFWVHPDSRWELQVKVLVWNFLDLKLVFVWSRWGQFERGGGAGTPAARPDMERRPGERGRQHQQWPRGPFKVGWMSVTESR